MSGYRLEAGGSGIDRERPLSFAFDGRSYGGYQGDTLASALIASGVDVVARSFKYHRPRGILSAGSEEPSALVTLGEGARAEPNARATAVPLRDGLTARAQNAWPSLRFDVMAANGLAGPLIGAGFYYKTFLAGGARVWTRLFEPAIRRAAGMGRASLAPDPDRYEETHAFCDLLVVGGGPAGLMAARTAAAAGLRVILADEGERMGGALLHETVEVDGVSAPAFAARVADDLRDRATILPKTTVYGYYDGLFAAVERVSDHAVPGVDAPRQRHWLIRPQRVILATGAIERPIVFAGNDRPGIMLADAVRAYANRYGVAAGRKVAVFTTHDGAYRTVRDLNAAAVRVSAVIDARETIGDAARAVAEAAGARLKTGGGIAAAHGARRLDGVTLTDGYRVECDTLAVSGGWVPTIHLTSQAGTKPIWDAQVQSFVAGALPDKWDIVGAATGTFDLSDVLDAGVRAGAHAAAERGRTADAEAPLASSDLLASDPAPIWRVPGRGKAFVDLQHDVTADDVERAQREGFEAVEHLKRYTTLGMAADQGKTSNLNGLALMAKARGIPIADAGTTRFRPPYTPVALGALAGASTGANLKPERRTPMHDWHDAHGAVWVDAGLWKRPRAYLRRGESVRDAYIREARAVRAGVGIVDVSTLGKIEVAGPDAATFLNHVYTNGWTKLPVGKARYGVMLRDDGFVLDDGTTWRLAEHRFLMTTTTVNAARVLSHLEVLLATVWPDLRVRLTSVTEQWAGMAVAGPRSRDALAAAISDLDLSNEAFPFMGVREAKVSGAPSMVTRLSFSGELAYEVHCGAGHGQHVWDALMRAGQAFGIVPYGTEALGTLRIEKGHVSGSELDGRTTLDDLGLAGLASATKPFVGSVLRARPNLTDPGRKRLVGLRSLDGTPIKAGAHLVEEERRSLGHVTAVTYSPELEAEIALALLEGGLDRLGANLAATYPLKNLDVPVEVVSPHFVDPEGARMHV